MNISVNLNPFPMNLKELFGVPQVLLLISILIGPLFWGNSSIDIQIHDTLYVIVGMEFRKFKLLSGTIN